MKNLICLFIIPISIVVGCQTVVDVDFPPIRPNIAVNCLFTADSLFEVKVYKTLSLLDTADFSNLTNASVILYEDGIQVDSLLYYDDLDMYKSMKIKGVTGKTYKIKVTAPGYEEATAENFIPSPPQLVSAVYRDSTGFKHAYKDFDITLNDSDPAENYYSISLSVRTYYINQSNDTVYYVNSSGSDLDKVLPPLVKGMGSSFLCNDRLFNGKQYTVEIQSPNFIAAKPGPKTTYTVNIKSVTKEYYDYFTKIDDHLDHLEEDLQKKFFVSEPVFMPSNIKGGFGVFVGYSSASYPIEKAR